VDSPPATRRVRLGTILVLIVLVTTVPLAALAGRLILGSWREQQALVSRQNEDRTRAIAHAVDQEVLNTVAQLRIISELEPINAEDLRSFHKVAAELVDAREGWQSIRLVLPTKRVMLDTSLPFGAPSSLVSDDWVEQVRTNQRFAVSTLRRDPRTGEPFVSIGVPVTRNKTVRFVLGVRVLAREFSRILVQQQAPPDGVLSLLDSEFTVMARTRAEDKYIGFKPTPDFSRAILSAPEGSVRSTVLEGTPTYSAWHRSPTTGWTVALGVPSAAVDRQLWRSLGVLVALSATILGGGLTLALLVSRRIVRAQMGAVSAARALARGEPVQARPSRVEEFNDLSNGLRDAAAILEQRLRERDEAETERNKAVAELNKAVAELERALTSEQAARAAGERNEARLSVTLRSIAEGVIATDAEGRVTMLNTVAQALTGWPEAEAIGQPIDAVFETVDERTRRPVPSPLARALSNQDMAGPSHAVLMARDGRDIPIGDSAAAIRSADGTLQGIVVVFRDVTADRDAERHRAAALEREQAARRAAESLSRAKDEFVATVSHELRTPLNAIFGWVAMLKMASLDQAGREKALDVIERNTRVQAHLIEDLLDMARFSRGTVRLELQPVDLGAVLESAVDAVKPAADARRVVMTVHAPRGIAVVAGDAGRLQQVAWNLLSNSIKFSDAGDQVEATLEVEGDDAVLRVKDTGSGIDPAFLPHVFDRFRQEISDVTREHAGLGLGLSLVRHLTELHGGRVTAQSEGKDRGATFTVRLPLIGTCADGDVRFGTAEDSIVRQEIADALDGLDVLVVDDEPDARELTAAILKQAGAHVRTAASAHEALDLLEAQAPSLVVTDIAMPHATGFDLVENLRADPRWSALPVIAVTAYARAEDKARALALGFHAHVGKPFSPRTLVAVAAELARR
jgi:PAS domain S-box-containing protein